MMPYARTRAIFESPTPGGHFLFNMNLAGVSITTVREPTATPLWWEKIDKSTDPLNVAFSDGHVKQIDQATLKTNLGWKFERKANMKPLPIDYLVPKKS
jgi:prepilin-type processing-associated H-X9-DG protein